MVAGFHLGFSMEVFKYKEKREWLYNYLIGLARRTFMSKEEKERTERAIQLFLERIRISYVCDGVDESECYANALEVLNGPWMGVEVATGLVFDYMYNHCRGFYEPTLIGVFKSQEEGCRPLATIKQRVEFEYENGRVKSAKISHELFDRFF